MGTQDQDIMVGVKPELYQRIERAAAQRDLSIREYLEDVLERIVTHDIGAFNDYQSLK